MGTECIVEATASDWPGGCWTLVLLGCPEGCQRILGINGPKRLACRGLPKDGHEVISVKLLLNGKVDNGL